VSDGAFAEILDVSRYQHPGNPPAPIDWQAVRASGVCGVYVKATEGTGYVSPSLVEDVTAARAAGLCAGIYHFQRGTDVAGQVANFLAAVAPLAPFDLPWALDVEVGHSEAGPVALAILRAVEPTLGPGVVYTYEHFQEALAGAPELGDYPVWLAAYRASPPVPGGPWKGRAWAWQYTGHGRCPGVVGDVDRSRMRL
jgi:lysozyme